MNHQPNRCILAGLGLVLCFGIPDAQALFGSKETPTEDADAQMDLPEYKGLKHAIGVKDFDNEAGWRGQWELGGNLSIMLESALYDTGRFVLVEREQLDDVMEEQDLMAEGRMAAAKEVAKTGKLRPAKYLATGAITTVDAETGGGDGGIRVKGFSIGLGKKKATVTIVAKLVDTTTGEIVAKKSITGTPSGSSIRVGYSGADFGGDLGGFTKTPLGQAAQDAINQAAKFFALNMEEIPFEGSVVKVTGSGQVIVNRGSDYGIEEGQMMMMATEGEVLMDPDTGAVLDREEGEVIGTLKAARVREKITYCDVVDGEGNPPVGTNVLVK